ncbi:MAG TPA: hypothetical protein VF826_09650 [Chloroflexia bacterium]
MAVSTAPVATCRLVTLVTQVTLVTLVELVAARRPPLLRAAREGYVRDEFCLDAAAFGQPPEQGAMGFHATNETLLRGPIDSNRPQALMFDSEGRVLGVEYEVVADAVSEPPSLFGRTFGKLPAHAGVEHEHYALHLWFIENPNGALADFNPSVSCLPGSTPGHDTLGARIIR